MSIATINVELNDDSSEVTLTGSYDNVINAICAGIKGLIVNMCQHPKYIEIKEKSELDEQEFEQELVYTVMLNIMDRIDDHYVMSVEKLGNLNVDSDVTTFDINTDIDIDCDAFEAFINHSETEGENDEKKE